MFTSAFEGANWLQISLLTAHLQQRCSTAANATFIDKFNFLSNGASVAVHVISEKPDNRTVFKHEHIHYKLITSVQIINKILVDRTMSLLGCALKGLFTQK